MDDQTAMGTPLLISGPFQYYRTTKDKPWVYVYSFLWLTALVGGVFAWQHRNPIYAQITPDYLNDPTHCPFNVTNHGRSLLGNNDPPPFQLSDFWSHTAWWLLISISASLAIGVLFLVAVRHHAFALARATIGFQIAMPLIVALGLTFSGNLGASAGPWLLTALSAGVFYMWRNEIAVSTRLLQVAGHGLAANARLIGLPVLLNAAAVFASIPLFILAAVGVSNGDVVPNPARQGGETCIDVSTGQDVLCCAWMPRPAAMGYLGILGVTAAWTMFTLYQIRVFTVSGTIAQWYFAPVGNSTKGNLKRSLNHATGPQLGTNLFAGLVMVLTQSVKDDAERSQREGNISIFGFITSMLASFLEYLTKFAVVFSAITGDALIDAGKRVTDLLARNLLTTIAATVWFPSALLTFASITLSVLWGTAVGVTYNWLHHSGGVDKELYPGSNAVVLGVIVGVSTLVVLQFLIGVLLSILDAVFVCWALDRDRAVVSNGEVHEVFGAVAAEKGAVLAQPSAQIDA